MSTTAIPLDWLPTLPRRYAATVIDGLLVAAAIVAPSALWPTNDGVSRRARILLAAASLFLYEPLCTGHFVTVGQRLTGVRVRMFDTGGKIGLVRAYGRIVVKLFLGWISFLVLPFTAGRRAIHDIATGSIVIMAASELKYSKWASSPADEGTEMMALDEFARRYAEAWCSQDPESVASFFAEAGSLSVNDGAPAVGRAAIAEVARGFMTAFPDMVVIMNELIRKPHGVEFHWMLSGTNTGPHGTGRRVRISGYEEWQIDAGGLVAGSKGHFDVAEFERQLERGVDE